MRPGPEKVTGALGLDSVRFPKSSHSFVLCDMDSWADVYRFIESWKRIKS